MRYHLGWVDESGNPQHSNTGKLLRPKLCLIACEAVGGNWQKALPAAAVLELVHNFTLVHDDIEDQSDYRRHRRTVWNIWGQAQAINVGDGMYSLSRLGLIRLSNAGFNPKKVFNVMQMMDLACVKLCEGQYLDMCFESKYDVSIDEYLEMIGKKTANLIGCALKMGATLGTDNDAVIQNLEQFGWKMGMAFQIQDDILGIWGAEDKTGKSMSDIAQKKKSLPIVYGLTSADSKYATIIRNVYTSKNIEDQHIAAATNALDKISARNYCHDMADDYYKDALLILNNLEIDEEARQELIEIADFFVKRDF
jgi:geranylgeranyl diphosphate synthase type I